MDERAAHRPVPGPDGSDAGLRPACGWPHERLGGRGGRRVGRRVALVSRRLAPTPVSGPMLLVAAGVACGPVGLDLLDLTRDSEAVGLLFEFALVTVLFSDAGPCAGPGSAATTRCRCGC